MPVTVNFAISLSDTAVWAEPAFRSREIGSAQRNLKMR